MTAATLPDTFFHTRDNPWYGVGTVLDGPASSREALVAAGLDWEVDVQPLYVQAPVPAGDNAGGAAFVKVPDKRAVIRRDTLDVLGVVGGNYKPFQNVDAFAFADALVDDGGLVFDSAGSYRGLRRVFLVAKLPQTVEVLGEDPYDLYLFLVTSHDGTLAITAYVSHVRLACTNMLGLSLREAVTKWTIRHTSSAEGRIAEAREALGMTFKADAAFQAEMEKLARVQVSDAAFREILQGILPDSARRDEKLARIVQVRNESPSIDTSYVRSGYGALQAFSEWMDWGREVRSDEARFQVSFDGYGARQRSRLYRALAEAA